jgi:hypothetical protein
MKVGSSSVYEMFKQEFVRNTAFRRYAVSCQAGALNVRWNQANVTLR